MAEVANQIFLPFVQPGIARSYADASADRLGTAVQPSVINMQVRLTVNADTVDKALRVYGPGDVTGIDPHQVVRTEPKARTTDFEPNYFAAIEFDRPDLPWLFTPAKADAQGRLRPWMCLVVVRKQQGVELRPPGALPLPVLSIASPARPADELPDLLESWAWAHAQLTGAALTEIETKLKTDPARNVSRLLSPRRLLPSTEYIACVVPTFEVGRKAGLGIAIAAAEEARLDPAWTSGAQAPPQVTLPVYYSWEFRTGVGGDFEELVRRLQPRALPPEVGKRRMDLSHPGFAMRRPDGSPVTAATPGAVLGLEGALRVLKTMPDDWADDTRLPFQGLLMPILNTPWRLATQPGAAGDPVVAPPVYGCWHAAAHDVSNAPPPAPAPAWPASFWFNELNLDPRHRVAAGLGTQVVQAQQEQLMASAWAQIGDVQKVNQRRRQAQLSRAVNERFVAKTFSRLPEESFLRIVSPAQTRLVLEERPPLQPTAAPTLTPLAVRITTSFVPPAAVSAPMRKLLRPRGAINRQFAQAQTPGAVAMMSFFNVAAPPAPAVADRGGVTIDRIADSLLPTDPFRFSLRSTTITPTRIAAIQPIGTNIAFRDAALPHQQYLVGLFATPIFLDLRRTLDAPSVKALALASLDPAKAVTSAVAAGLRVSSPPLRTSDPLEPVMDAPTFPQPMYEALRDLSQDYLLPGLEHVPPNTVQLLQTNAKFIESFMVGLNTEMGRELLWRDFPTDQRGTYFQQFWDTAAAGAPPAADIPPIHQWGPRPLGTVATGAGGDKVVLLIRGELLRRYPGTVIYAVQGVIKNGKRAFPDGPVPEQHPIFRGSLEPDVTFIGFNLTQADVTGTPGWYFVLQQQPTEPRFGMDDDPFGPGESGEIPELKTWNDLNWAHIARTPAALASLTYVPVNKLKDQLKPTQVQPAVKGTWARNGAHMAYITKQLPSRVAIHASEMIP